MPERSYPVSRPSIGALEAEYVLDAVQSGWISSIGPYVTRFESDFAAFCETRHAVAVSNGTVALHLAMMAYDIGPGDEVIVPDLSFIATANSVLMAGATPVFCDIEPETLCLDPAALESLITPRTKAVMPVHLYGHPADMPAINAVAARHGLKVIEDAAEAHGAAVLGKPVGGLGDCATFSFYGNKNLTTGEGGMITSDDDAFIARCRVLRDHAMSPTRRYWHEELGYNYRMTNLQAALGCAQLERSEALLEGRRRVFAMYRQRLEGVPGLKLSRTAQWARHAHWLVCVEIEGLDHDRREAFMDRLRARGIDTRPYFYPMSHMPYLTQAATPVASRYAQIGLNLPTYIELEQADIDYICDGLIAETAGLAALA
ncbi:DegT/DnrJ/EryC1/StrS family aminotransferase [Caulobacter sp. NIBR1757]|uniref:DegT/DnrJ/EryC1/StrS family aminotransferase n=1 Tax=Caulobacter sp. NIBR1757 TaxID=3016000 RepID=UPI0022F0E8AF|nr:DegT/DnrJ/EryC1/StrS family aminotransferase [Caulobacter sp. NIBR1757]WGM40033.1 GDP-perosamine synthase [Caulobacter sp. NIBR1757]